MSLIRPSLSALLRCERQRPHTYWLDRLFNPTYVQATILRASKDYVDDIIITLKCSGHFPTSFHWPDDSYAKAVRLFKYVDDHDRNKELIIDVENAYRQHRQLHYLLLDSSLSTIVDLPLPPTIFGRESELQEYVDVLGATPKPKAVAICGVGGIGKTALALAVLNHAALEERFGTRRFFVYCEYVTTVDALVSQLVETLIVRDPASPFPMNKNLNIVVESLASRLALHLPTLCCLDNFESVFDNDETKACDLLRALLKCSTLALIVTMRGRCPPLIDPRWHTNNLLGGLEATTALSLFEADAGHVDHDSPEAVDKLLAKLGGHPLSVKLVARQVTRDQSAVDTLKRYEVSGARILTGRGKSGKLDSLQVSLDLSYNGPCITDSARLLFRLLSYLPLGLSHGDLTDFLGTVDAGEVAQLLVDAALITVMREGDST